MTVSRPATPAAPRARRSLAPEGVSGVLIALAVLTAVLGGAALIAWLLSGAVADVLPKAPPYLILVLFVPLLIVLMLAALRLLPLVAKLVLPGAVAGVFAGLHGAAHRADS